MKKLTLLTLLLIPFITSAATNYEHIQSVKLDLNDKASLQRGAKLYMNYCAGCHSLQYMRYQQMAEGLNLVDSDGKVAKQAVEKNLIFTQASIHDYINRAMPKKTAADWFGVNPPDLTLSARVRGTDWLYSYLLSFYTDKARPWGVNNLVYPQTAMPNVLWSLQGDQLPVYHIKEVTLNEQGKPQKVRTIDHLQRVSNGTMNEHQFHHAIRDIVSFLAYTAEPVGLVRPHIGFWVLLYLIVLLALTYLLKRAYWQNVK